MENSVPAFAPVNRFIRGSRALLDLIKPLLKSSRIVVRGDIGDTQGEQLFFRVPQRPAGGGVGVDESL